MRLTGEEGDNGLELAAEFIVPAAYTWGNGEKDREARKKIRARLPKDVEWNRYEWFEIWIDVRYSLLRPRLSTKKARESWVSGKTMGPDADNFAKPVCDALTGIVYPDDHILYLRHLRVNVELVSERGDSTFVRVFGKPKQW